MMMGESKGARRVIGMYAVAGTVRLDWFDYVSEEDEERA